MAKKINLNNIEAFAKKNAAEADRRRVAQAAIEARMRKEKEERVRVEKVNVIDPILAFILADALMNKK